MTTSLTLHQLLAWTSPSYPIGAFTYSHGLETSVQDGAVVDGDGLLRYVAAVLERGGLWIDAVLFARGYEAADDPQSFDALAEYAAAFRATSETALESRQQARAFLKVTQAAWPHPTLGGFVKRWGDRHVAYPTALALACYAHGVPCSEGLRGMLHGSAANLVSAGVRLIPLGQTDGQVTTARLASIIDAVTEAALRTSIDELGSSAPMLDIISIRHETLYTRLFRS